MGRMRSSIVATLAMAWLISACDETPATPDAGDADSGVPMQHDDAGPQPGDDAGPQLHHPDGGTSDDGGTDPGDDDVCGDGVVTGSETCDRAIPAGSPGACPTSCNDGLACTNDVLEGSAATCDARCTTTPITACVNDDSCCPSVCTTENDSDCSCTPRTSCDVGECGIVDDGCGGPLNCGTCAIGGQCHTDADCESGICVTEASSGWTGGFCTLGCTTDEHCGTGAHCAYRSDGPGVCLATCDGNEDCRDDYTCQDIDGDGARECAPSGTGTGAIGAPCDRVADCSGGDPAYCLVENRGWQDGYCTRECTSDADCGSSAHCAAGIDDRACLADCEDDSDCRSAGYLCYDVDGDGQKECAPAATGSQPTGEECVHTFECTGGVDGICIDDGDFFGGYCSAFCTSDADCASGHCTELRDFSVCTASCRTDADCRAPGYACFDLDEDGRKECWPAATGTGDVGSACQFIWECAGGEDGACITEEDGFRDGYCVQRCGTGASCPSGSHCALVDPSSGEGICLADCTPGSCRHDGRGYLCEDVDGDSVTECIPGGSSTVGGPCESDWDCETGMTCLPEQPDGAFPGGYCTKECDLSNSCPSGECIHFTAIDISICLSVCTTVDDCRTGYGCHPIDDDLSICFALED